MKKIIALLITVACIYTSVPIQAAGGCSNEYLDSVGVPYCDSGDRCTFERGFKHKQRLTYAKNVWQVVENTIKKQDQ